MLERAFISSQRLYGSRGFEAIAQSHGVVVGIGGVGSWAAETLARTGVGRITLIDMDHIAPSNLNRQVHALSSTMGQAKVEAMRERIALINPSCVVHCVDDFVTPENWDHLVKELQLMQGPERLGVIDACDQLNAKIAMAHWACGPQRSRASLHYVCVGAAGGKRLLSPVEVADLCQVTHDPLLAQMRYRLRKTHHYPKEGKKMGVSCVFSREAVAKPIAAQECEVQDANTPTLQRQDRPTEESVSVDHNLSCHGYGSSMAVTASFGIAAANFLINCFSKGVK